MHLDAALDLFAMTRREVVQLVEPIPDERWAEQPSTIPNHPAWTVGHLSFAISFGLELLGRPPIVDDAWVELMDRRAPVPDRGAYPERGLLLSTFERAHGAFADAVRATDRSIMQRTTPYQFFPTLGHATAYFLMAHEPRHIGQLLGWRRAAGLAPTTS